MKTILLLINAALILFFVYRLAKRWKIEKSRLFWTSFAFHLIAGISVGLVYKYYYTSNDTWFFFENASKVADLAKQDFITYLKVLFDFSDNQNSVIETKDFRSMIFIKMISVSCFISDNNYWVCSAYFSFFSFVSSWFLHRRVIEFFPESLYASVISFLFFPSVVFWSSGIEKESLTLSSLYFLSGIVLTISFGKKYENIFWPIVFVSGFVVWLLKYYWAAVFFMAATAALLTQFLSKKYSKVENNRVFTYFFLFFVLGITASFLHPNFYLERFMEVVVTNHQEFINISSDQNLIHYHQLQPMVMSMIINSPWALVSGIFRPFVGEGHGILGWVASLENFLTLVLFAGFVMKLKQKKQRANILFLATLSYCVVLCIFLALSTPNLGTLSRYRVGFLPFLIFILAYQNPIIDSVVKKFRIKS